MKLYYKESESLLLHSLCYFSLFEVPVDRGFVDSWQDYSSNISIASETSLIFLYACLVALVSYLSQSSIQPVELIKNSIIAELYRN